MCGCARAGVASALAYATAHLPTLAARTPDGSSAAGSQHSYLDHTLQSLLAGLRAV